MSDISIREWYPWWASRWKNSDAFLRLTLAEQGAYRNLLDAEWVRGGYLPSDHEMLWSLAGARSYEEFIQLWPRIKPWFDESEDGLSNPVLMEELSAAQDRVKKRSEAGRKGGLSSASSRAQAIVKQSLSTASINKEAIVKQTSTTTYRPTDLPTNQPKGKPETETTPEDLSLIQYAQKILEDLGLPTKGNIHVVADAITAEAKFSKITLAQAFDKIQEAAMTASLKVEITRFWFQDAKWRPSKLIEKPISGSQMPNPAELKAAKLRELNGPDYKAPWER